MLRRAAAVFRLGELRVCDWVLLQIHKQRTAMRDKFKPKEAAGMTAGKQGGNKGKAIFKKKEGPSSKPKPQRKSLYQGGHKKNDSPSTPAPKAPAA